MLEGAQCPPPPRPGPRRASRWGPGRGRGSARADFAGREGGAGGGARRARRGPPPTQRGGGGGPALSSARALGLSLANKCLWRSPRGPDTSAPPPPGGPPCSGPGSYGAGPIQRAPGRAVRQPPPRPSGRAAPAAPRGGRGLGSAARRAGAGSPRDQRRPGCRRARSRQNNVLRFPTHPWEGLPGPRAASQFPSLSPGEDPPPGGRIRINLNRGTEVAPGEAGAGAAASCPLGAQRSGVGGPEPRRGPRAGDSGTKRAAARGGGRAAHRGGGPAAPRNPRGP